MSRMRYEIQQLGQTVQTTLGRLTQDLLDIDVRTTAFLDSIFGEIEQDMGVSLRAATIAVLREFTEQPLEMSRDRKYIYVGNKTAAGGCLATVTRLAKQDRISIPCPRLSSMPTGDFTYKADHIVFDLDGEHNIQLVVDFMQAAIDREAQ